MSESKMTSREKKKTETAGATSSASTIKAEVLTEKLPGIKDEPMRSPAGFPIVGIGASAGGLADFEAFFPGMPADGFPGKLSLRELTERALLQQVAPTGALVNNRGDILYLHGRTGMYLEPVPGESGIATIFVDHVLHILRFTPAANRIMNLIPGDVGRPVGHIVSNLGYDGLIRDVQTVMDTLIPKEMEVQSTEGLWYTMRIQPYRTLDNVIEGAVLTFVDITSGRKTKRLCKLRLKKSESCAASYPPAPTAKRSATIKGSGTSGTLYQRAHGRPV